jgi:outer membrane protein
MNSSLKAATLALLCVPLAAHAAGEAPPRWTFGALAIERDAPYRGLDEGLIVAPLVRFEGERFYLRGLRGGVVLHESGGFAFGPFLQFRGDGYDSADSDFLAGMDDRRFSLDGGFAASWRGDDFGQIEFSVATDVLDRSGGHEAELSYTALFDVGGWTFVPAVAAKWQSEDLVDYYWGVRADEALPGRPAYRADAALLPELSLLVTRRFGAWTLYARVAHTWLPDEIADSPIVDGNGRTGVILGLGWSPD